VILSGAEVDPGGRTYTGVGFLGAPWAWKHVMSYKQVPERVALIKIKVRGGQAGIITAYAPPGMHYYDVRQTFFTQLGDELRRSSVHGPKYVLCDMNSRLLRQLPGETDVVGQGILGSASADIADYANRHLLLELCYLQKMVLASTMFPSPPEELATYFDFGVNPYDPVIYPQFAQLDFVLAHSQWQHTVLSTKSVRSAGLASHHFMLRATLDIEVPKIPKREQVKRSDTAALANETLAESFANVVAQELGQVLGGVHEPTPDMFQEHFEWAFAQATAVLPTTVAQARRPWTSSRTLKLIEARNVAEIKGDRLGRQLLTQQVRQSAKKDRRRWLEELVETGGWDSVRRLRRGFAPRPSKLKNAAGEVVESTLRADTTAEYFEQVPWRVRPDTIDLPGAQIGPDIAMNLGDIMHEEILQAVKALKNKKACGADNVPAEFWKAIMKAETEAGVRVTEFCNACWKQKRVPVRWHLARVAAIFKKEHADDPGNYRPISLLCIVYKVFASVMLRRLKEADAEGRVWKTQFGFKSGYGTADALLLARRMIEAAWTFSDGKLLLLALDWAKAFDSVSPAALCGSLRRFGLPHEFVAMVESIYDGRKFFVPEAGQESSVRSQAFGITQGCPLSPFLFVIMMTVLMHDTASMVSERFPESEVPFVLSRSLLYADDTLIAESDAPVAQFYMECIASIGARYGMAFNWGKLEVLRVRHDGHIHLADGSRVKDKDAMVYLGSVLSADGRIAAELARRLGMARSAFQNLEAVWKHANIPRNKTKSYTGLACCKSSCIACTLHGFLQMHSESSTAFTQDVFEK